MNKTCIILSQYITVQYKKKVYFTFVHNYYFCSTAHQPLSPEHAGDNISLLPTSSTPLPSPSPAVTTIQFSQDSVSVEPDEAASLTTQQALDSTETLKRGEDEHLISSCESAKTICDAQDVEEVKESLRTPSISMEEEQEVPLDSSAENSGIIESEERVHLAQEEAPRRPDSLKGIQSFQNSQSDLASLGLAFPAQNGSLAIARWPSMTDRTAPSDDWESYTYSPGYERAHSKTDSTSDR